ncbi:hypothetical protein BG842_02540 [Haladaptatus sp. W1]|nr:hypothetical protein BG842_02540 [Haladaptatus sp. W1]
MDGKQFGGTMRHKSFHMWQCHEFGEADHNEPFKPWTDALDTIWHCERFTSPMVGDLRRL